MEWVETTGRTVEEAKDAALDQLGVDEQDAEFEVVEEPKTGLFGRLRAEARVRARVRPTRPRPKDDRRDKRRGRDRDRGDAKRGPKPADAASPTSTAPATNERPRRERADGNGGAGLPDLTLAEQGELAGEFLRGLVARIGAQAEVSVDRVADDTVQVNIEGGDLGLLIGPRGQTLAALQELTRTVVQRKTGGREGWVLVDVSGYRKKRREALEKFARHVAEQVLASGTPTSLEPMSAADRKIVHDAINEIDGVETTSEGEDPRRRVVVRPA